MSRKNLFDESEFDAKEARRLIVEGVKNWDRDRLLAYAQECVEIDVRGMTDAFLFGFWQDEYPDLAPPMLEQADEADYGVPRFEIEHRKAS